ncbi:MAG: outer membrane protein assembly factor BamD [Bacteroidia bacterium]
MIKRLPILVLFVLSLISCDRFNKLLKSTDYDLKYEKAKEYYGKENWTKASQLFEELIPIVKGTDKAEEVYYYYAWCQYYMNDYMLAQYHFKNFTRQFPASSHSEECYFYNAMCFYYTSPAFHLDQTSTVNAIKEFQTFVDNYPDSKRIDSCNTMIDLLRAKIEKKDYEIVKQYFKLEDYKATIVASKGFIKENPSSIHNDEMYYLMIDSYYLLANNSIQSKKAERYQGAMENYLKLVDLFPNSSYISRAENIYNSCKKQREKFN